MAGSIVALKVGGMSYIADTATEDYMSLACPTAVTTNGITFHTSANVNYQVSAGKTFTILGFLYSGGTGSGIVTIYQNDAADTTDGTDVDKAVILYLSDLTAKLWIPTPDLPTVAAQKFLNVKTTITANSSQVLEVIGFES